ncbi:MAG: type III pantothenate kinase [Eggerthellaceae bacterium]|nr:type III pantothenate kinase [Eggerthellaceae bacterium]
MGEPTVLAVTIENAETTLGLFAGDELLSTWSVSTSANITADEAMQCAWTFLNVKDLPAPDDAIMCSVVPALTAAWSEALATLSGKRALIVGPGLKSGIAMDYKDPGQVGGDRVACAVAAKAIFGAPVIVVDFGAATTFTVVGEKGSLAGGAIAPGLRVSMEALSGAAAQLTETDLQAPTQVVGRTTLDAVRAGIVLGETAKVDGLVEAMWDELGCETALVATGRWARVVCACTHHEFEIRDDLALRGLLAIRNANRK